MRSVELFAGAGGLALGISNAGFKHEAVVEWNKYACDTIRQNKEDGMEPVAEWPLFEGDVADFDYSTIGEGIDLLAGGPPCQPFSLGGKHRGHTDERNMFPQVFRAVRELRPKAILIENVKGLLRDSFAEYFRYIHLHLKHPECIRKVDEAWPDHLARLEKVEARGRHEGLHYNVQFKLLNAADYGVPQRRERVIFVGFRSDLNVEWSYPTASHSKASLLHDKWVTGNYWDRHSVPKKRRPTVPTKFKNAVLSKTDAALSDAQLLPWRTVRDAISDLPDPEGKAQKNLFLHNHVFVPGARSYKGHTGSPYDEPAKTLKAGDHGVPGGENTVAYPDGSFRYFTVRESARLQTFPDDYRFHGSWGETMRQLGNAVPVRLGQVVAEAIHAKLTEASLDASNAAYIRSSRF